jgi:hypothetical protein
MNTQTSSAKSLPAVPDTRGIRPILADWKRSGTIFLLALTVRIVVGWIFFGCIDLTNTLLNNQALASGDHAELEKVPYFPVLGLFIWLGGALNMWTSWPLAFCYKLVPIFCDAMIAALIFDIVRARRPALAFRAGIFYALAPVPIIITCIHGGWDCAVLLPLLLAFHIREDFRESRWSGLMFGAFFISSFLVKPFAVMFAPIFFRPWNSAESKTVEFRHGLILTAVFVPVFLAYSRHLPVVVLVGLALAFVFLLITVINIFACLRMPDKGYLRSHLAAGFGLVLVGALAMVSFHLFGYSIHKTLHRIYEYSQVGVQIFGLPFAYPFSLRPQIMEMRLWILPIIGVILLFYFTGRVSAFNVLLAGFTFILGTAGLSPQYLVWPVPLLLILLRFRMAALYTVLATVFLLFFYANPWGAYFPNENMNTFATLKSWHWLMPSADFASVKLLGLIHILGNYAIPFCSLAFAVMVLAPLLRHRNLAAPVALYSQTRPFFNPWRNLQIWLAAFLTIGVLFGTIASRSGITEPALKAMIMAKSTDYAFVPTTIKSLRFPWIGDYPTAGAGSFWNIVNLGLIWAILWAAASVVLTLVKPSVAESAAAPVDGESPPTCSASTLPTAVSPD